MTQRQIIEARTDEQAAVAARIIARAFSGLKPSTWLVPDPERRVTVLEAVFTIDIHHAMEHGVVLLLPNSDDVSHGGVSVWVDRTKQVPAPEDSERRLNDAAGPFAERFRILDDLFTTHHPNTEHHHLALHAAVPQSLGSGTALLRHHQTVLDNLGVPAYLEAASDDAAHFYLKNGFQHLSTPFSLPNKATFHPMWRDPL